MERTMAGLAGIGAWVGAGVAAAVLAAGAAAVVGQPRADASPATDAGPVWQISRGGAEIATSRQCTGLGSRSDVVEHRDGSEPGVTRKTAGLTRATDVTCSLALSSDRRVYDWRKQVQDGRTDLARSAVVLSLLDGSGAPVQRWQLTNAWPSQYLVAFDRAVVTLTHEDAELLP